MTRLVRGTGKVLRPVHPNAGLEIEYRRRLHALVEEMHDSVLYWLKAAYRANEPVMARDDVTPAISLRVAMRRLVQRWQRRINEAAPALAEYFATATAERSDAVLRSILRNGGMTVKFSMTPAMRDVLKATLNQQVSLIKSIPTQYLSNVEGMVMRSVQTGRDLGQLTKDLEEQYGVTRRRAALIARDQNNKATASFTRVRQTELGITEAVWMHSGGGRHPRQSHLKNNGKKYEIAKGWFDPEVKKWVFPGELISCRCVSRAVLPGF